MKAALAAARYAEPDADEVLPHRVTDLVSLEAQIRRFVADAGATSMALPPADKATRKRVHELANAFNLKSESRGAGAARYTTLAKTSKSGLHVNERKVKRVLRESGAWDWQGPPGTAAGGKKMSLAKHQEGEEVGKVRALPSARGHGHSRWRAGGAEADRGEPRIQDARVDGLGGGRPHRTLGRPRRPARCEDEEDEARAGGERPLSSLPTLALLPDYCLIVPSCSTSVSLTRSSCSWSTVFWASAATSTRTHRYVSPAPSPLPPRRRPYKVFYPAYSWQLRYRRTDRCSCSSKLGITYFAICAARFEVFGALTSSAIGRLESGRAGGQQPTAYS